MKTESFQNLLLKSAVCVMGCDGDISELEINEIKSMIEEEIYFLGYDSDLPFTTYLKDIQERGLSAIEDYFTELDNHDLNADQELLLVEVLIRTIESDKKIEENEMKFLHMVKSRLGIEEKTIISKFPRQMSYLIDSKNYGLNSSFRD